MGRSERSGKAKLASEDEPGLTRALQVGVRARAVGSAQSPVPPGASEWSSKMKKALATVLALGVVAATAPATAQSYYGRDDDRRYEERRHYDDRRYEERRHYDDRRYDDRYERRVRPKVSYQYRVRSLDERIDRAYATGRLTRGEAARLYADLDRFARLVHRYQRGGLTVRENAELNDRYTSLNLRLRAYVRNGVRDYGYGYGRY
jgi:hypothetical protein